MIFHFHVFLIDTASTADEVKRDVSAVQTTSSTPTEMQHSSESGEGFVRVTGSEVYVALCCQRQLFVTPEMLYRPIVKQ